jgi:hypothetical protein
VSQAAPARKLHKLDTTSVDLVTRGANNKRFALKKGADMNVQDALIEILKSGDMDQDWAAIDKMCADAGLDPQGSEVYKALVKLSSSYKDSPAMGKMVRENLSKLFGGAPTEAAPTAEPKEEKPDAPSAPAKEPPPDEAGKEPEMSEKTPVQSDGAKQAADAKQGEEELKKSIDARVEAAVREALAKSTSDSQAVIKAMEAKLVEQQDRVLKGEWIAKAKESLQFVPGKTVEELGTSLFELEKKAGADIAQAQFDVLKGASSAVQKSSALNPSGFQSRNQDSNGAMGKLRLAASKIAKSADANDVQAMRKSLESDPTLYAEYLNENPKQRGGAEYVR